MYAMRYGTVPIAHATGGLTDTIHDYNPFARGAPGPVHVLSNPLCCVR